MNILKATIIAFALTATATYSHEYDCPRLGETARDIMSDRQQGVPMSEALANVEGQRFLTAMVMDAYSVRRSAYEENQMEKVIEFRERVEVLCYKLSQ